MLYCGVVERAGEERPLLEAHELGLPQRLYTGVVYQLDFADFDETEFEEFCFELLRGLPGFHNVDWRKGTPKPSSRQTVAVISPPRSITSTSTERDTSKRGSWTASTTSAGSRQRLSKGF